MEKVSVQGGVKLGYFSEQRLKMTGICHFEWTKSSTVAKAMADRDRFGRFSERLLFIMG